MNSSVTTKTERTQRTNETVFVGGSFVWGFNLQIWIKIGVSLDEWSSSFGKWTKDVCILYKTYCHSIVISEENDHVIFCICHTKLVLYFDKRASWVFAWAERRT